MKSIFKELLRRIGAHNVTVTAAGIAFYGMLTLIPVLTALVATYALVTSDASQIEEQVREAAGALDGDTQALITDLISDIVDSMQGSAPVVIVGSIVVALFSASGTVQKLLGAISLAYETVDTRPGWLVRIISYGFTAAAIVLLAVTMSLISAVPIVLDEFDLGGGVETAIGLLRLPLAIALFTAGVTVLYRYGPRRDTPTPWLNPGSLVAVGLLVLFSLALSLYTSNVGELPPSYGLLGSIAVLMVFMQLAALAVIVGAEVNAAVETPTGEDPNSGPESDTNTVAPIEPLSSGKALAGFVAMWLAGRGPKG